MHSANNAKIWMRSLGTQKHMAVKTLFLPGFQILMEMCFLLRKMDEAKPMVSALSFYQYLSLLTYCPVSLSMA